MKTVFLKASITKKYFYYGSCPDIHFVNYVYYSIYKKIVHSNSTSIIIVVSNSLRSQDILNNVC